jgi:predicted nucleic acid-binding Zn finger protein
MLSISSQTGITYRSKCLPKDQAVRFSLCLQANPLFCDVHLCASKRAHEPRCWFVQFRPVSEERQAEMFARQQLPREERALAEGSRYVWCRDKNRGRAFFWLLSASGEVYEVDAGGRSCSCPDFTYRCQNAPGLRCKHLLALENGLGTVADFQPVPDPDRAARTATARAEIAAIYGR